MCLANVSSAGHGHSSWRLELERQGASVSHAAVAAVSLRSVHSAVHGALCMYTAGGWQQQMTFQRHVQNLQKFYRMLQNNGFHKDHIKTFFASSGQLPGETVFAF